MSSTAGPTADLKSLKKLPFSGEFSPGQVNLTRLLELISLSDGESDFVERVRAEYFSTSCERHQGEERVRQQTKRARNVLLGMRCYGIITDAGLKLTSIGQKLSSVIADEVELYETFAAHILASVRGMEVLTAVDRIRSKGEQPTKETLSAELRNMGFKVPNASTAHQTLLNWLKKANVFADEASYAIEPDRLAKILDTPATILTDLEELSKSEQLFLRALANLVTDETTSLNVSDVMAYAKDLFRLRVREDQWQAGLLVPLSKAGWFALERGTLGRGAKSGRLVPSAAFKSKYLKKLLEKELNGIPKELRKGLFRPLSQILKELESEDKNIKGRALEHLSARIAQLLDLKPRRLRLRSRSTGGAEVDLIAESTRLMFSRWQVQCKNTARLQTEDVAKEAGIALALRSQVILMVTTGRSGTAVIKFAQQIDEATAMQVIILDGGDLKQVAADGSAAGRALTGLLQERAERVMQHKAFQLDLPED